MQGLSVRHSVAIGDTVLVPIVRGGKLAKVDILGIQQGLNSSAQGSDRATAWTNR